MLWALLAAFASDTVAIDVTGMPPQVAEFRAIAKASKLPILCAGTEGEAQVLRIALPAGTLNPAEAQTVIDKLRSISTGLKPVDSATIASGKCDHEPVESHSEGTPASDPGMEAATHSLGYGPTERITALLQRAVSCGFAKAHIRPLSDGDRQLLGHARKPIAITDDWVVLDAGEPIGGRYYPLVCVIQPHRQYATVGH